MHLTMENPAALAGAHRVLNPVALSKATPILNTPITGESLAVAIMAHRYRLAIPTARTVCELAGIGRAL